MSEMHDMITDMTEKLFKSECTKEMVDGIEGGETAYKLWEQIEELGLPFIGLDESAGGVGGDALDTYEMLKLTGKYALPLPLFETVFSKWLLVSVGYPHIAGGMHTFCLNNPDDVVLTKVDGAMRARGRLHYIPWGRVANSVTALANVDGETSLICFSTEGVQMKKGNNIAGEYSDTMIFDDSLLTDCWSVKIDEDELKKKWLQLGALAKAAQMCGAMDTILQLCVDYVQEREQFGRPIAKFQAVQQQMALLAGHVLAATTMVNTSIGHVQTNFMVDSFDIAATKIRVSSLVTKVTELAHQIHGAIGVTYEHKLHQYTRRLWAWREAFGNEAYWEGVLAEMIQQSEEGIWSFMTTSEGKDGQNGGLII